MIAAVFITNFIVRVYQKTYIKLTQVAESKAKSDLLAVVHISISLGFCGAADAAS